MKFRGFYLRSWKPRPALVFDFEAASLEEVRRVAVLNVFGAVRRRCFCVVQLDGDYQAVFSVGNANDEPFLRTVEMLAARWRSEGGEGRAP